MKHCPLSLWGLPNQSLEDGKVGVPFNGPLSQVFSTIVHNVEETDVYEIGIQVHCGVILIINGREQFRVNVPSGPLASTAVSDCFPAPRYLYFVGNGNVLTPNTSITIVTMNRAKSSNITELSMWMAVYPQPSANRTISLLPSPIECYTIAYPNSLYVDNAFTHPPDIAKITDDDASTAPSTWVSWNTGSASSWTHRSPRSRRPWARWPSRERSTTVRKASLRSRVRTLACSAGLVAPSRRRAPEL